MLTLKTDRTGVADTWKINAFECYFYLGWAAQSLGWANKATVKPHADLWTFLLQNIMLL